MLGCEVCRRFSIRDLLKKLCKLSINLYVCIGQSHNVLFIAGKPTSQAESGGIDTPVFTGKRTMPNIRASAQSSRRVSPNGAVAQSPRLARPRLPWVNVARREQPQRGCGPRHTRRTEQTGTTALRLEMFV